MEKRVIRPAVRSDVPLLFQLITELADYENMSDQMVTTPALLTEWLFDKQKAEALIGEVDGQPVGYALFFHNFSTFLGRAGLYLEDLYVRPKARGHGHGKAFLKRLAEICVERDCKRLEWTCLDWNQPSIDFYLSMGAIPLRDWTVYRLSEEAIASLAAQG